MAKRAIVTGAAGGMGIATVERLSKDGFEVAALDINQEGLDEAKSRASGRVELYKTDLTDEAAVRDTVAEVQDVLGPVDALVNLIGWTTTQKFVDEDSEYWRRIVDINLMSVLYTTHACLPQMIEHKSGKIVTVTSDAGKVGQSGEAVYAAAKGGLIAWSKSLARELARFSINVNCTAPGPTDTPLEADQDPDIVARILKAIPFRRMAQPEEQAAAISFLCSDDANYITGQTFSISGGLTMS
jgi:2-hydroxycyclohexanecarboxyl-CoA dehydrogenase